MNNTNPQPVVISEDTRVQYAAQWMLSSTSSRWIKATTATTVSEYRGLTKAQADSMLADSTYNFVNRQDYAIGEYYAGTAVLAWWLIAPQTQGTESHTAAKRIGDSNLFTVTVTATSTTCTGSHSRVYP